MIEVLINIVCDGPDCTNYIDYLDQRSTKGLSDEDADCFAERMGWTVIGEKHYCLECSEFLKKKNE